MFATTDTIVAIATPPGRGGIGVVRVSGPAACAIASQLVTVVGELEPRRATLTKVKQSGRDAFDHVIVTFFPAPHSYTGDDVVEMSAHGSPVVLRGIVDAAMAHGARLAEPGEFTLRAFLNGRMDLMQAEAVADLIDAATPLQARAAFDQLEGTLTRTIGEIDAQLFDLVAKLEASVDFPDEGYHFVEPRDVACAIDRLLARTSALLADARRGRLIREGLQVAIVGRPNVGKSSLFNALVGAPRAIVSDTPGTTRDLVTETIDLDGLRVTLVDTAGLRETADAVEAEGVSRSARAQAVADLVLTVVDEESAAAEAASALSASPASSGSGRGSGPGAVAVKHFTVQTKSDLAGVRAAGAALYVSAKTGEGLDALRRAIARALDVDLQRDRPEITNVRHAALVERAHDALERARAAIAAAGAPMPEEFVLADLQEARAAFEEITGRRTSDDLLAHIFSRFCVGK
jgi:tRNA modification GTPase